MDLHSLFLTNRSDELDRSTEAADIDVSRKGCKTFMTFGNICMQFVIDFKSPDV